MNGLKAEASICPQTEDHVERCSKRNQAEEQQQRGDQSPTHQRACTLGDAIRKQRPSRAIVRGVSLKS